MKKIKLFWESLDDVATVSKRELFLGLVSCALAGIVMGFLFSPKKTMFIGSNNGNRACDGIPFFSKEDDDDLQE